VDNVEQADNVWVAHLLEERDLADGCRRHAFILGFQTDLLECDNAVVGGAEVAGFVNNTVCACETMVSFGIECEGRPAVVAEVSGGVLGRTYPRQSFPSSGSSP
jgi:hypothetical protein